MKQVKLYTLKEDVVTVTKDYINLYNYQEQPIRIRDSDEFIVDAPIEVQRLPVEYYQTRKDFGKPYETVSAHLVAFDPKIRELLGINEKQLKDELSQLKRLHDSALKSNETLVEYKNDLLRESSTLVEKLFTYTTMSFWKRLVFLFTGKVN